MIELGQGTETEARTSIRAKAGEILTRIPFEKDKIIFREGQDGTDAYVVESGRIGVFKTTDGKPLRLAVLEKGAIFGEMAAITGERRSATTIAVEPSVVVRISKTTIQQKIAHCDPFIKALIAILINNLGRVNERYATTNKVAEKLLSDLKAAQAEKPAEPPIDGDPASPS
jgi:CRP-like cAMP-binding protein